ncbi:uncharacterized protein HMPREF1541_04878 [Cyphellophora europaea CBS 101466]|uniref:Uncharacterized protein n=1 Tax=Cyphellophora europaea (strain CBS 101466) TaxID=1220924 RepID=W2RVQ4_CYPE1|nr:uncharacterized protein HMPREF1541_04878 [Cyphellophora europaea CBS 101466]ETN40601.1 hypothetical protein HMPREF1541_04878 [Cyphellophora europaea CBS 101466]
MEPKMMLFLLLTFMALMPSTCAWKPQLGAALVVSGGIFIMKTSFISRRNQPATSNEDLRAPVASYWANDLDLNSPSSANYPAVNSPMNDASVIDYSQLQPFTPVSSIEYPVCRPRVYIPDEELLLVDEDEESTNNKNTAFSHLSTILVLSLHTLRACIDRTLATIIKHGLKSVASVIFLVAFLAGLQRSLLKCGLQLNDFGLVLFCVTQVTLNYARTITRGLRPFYLSMLQLPAWAIPMMAGASNALMVSLTYFAQVISTLVASCYSRVMPDIQNCLMILLLGVIGIILASGFVIIGVVGSVYMVLTFWCQALLRPGWELFWWNIDRATITWARFRGRAPTQEQINELKKSMMQEFQQVLLANGAEVARRAFREDLAQAKLFGEGTIAPEARNALHKTWRKNREAVRQAAPGVAEDLLDGDNIEDLMLRFIAVNANKDRIAHKEYIDARFEEYRPSPVMMRAITREVVDDAQLGAMSADAFEKLTTNFEQLVCDQTKRSFDSFRPKYDGAIQVRTQIRKMSKEIMTINASLRTMESTRAQNFRVNQLTEDNAQMRKEMNTMQLALAQVLSRRESRSSDMQGASTEPANDQVPSKQPEHPVQTLPSQQHERTVVALPPQQAAHRVEQPSAMERQIDRTASRLCTRQSTQRTSLLDPAEDGLNRTQKTRRSAMVPQKPMQVPPAVQKPTALPLLPTKLAAPLEEVPKPEPSIKKTPATGPTSEDTSKHTQTHVQFALASQEPVGLPPRSADRATLVSEPPKAEPVVKVVSSKAEPSQDSSKQTQTPIADAPKPEPVLKDASPMTEATETVNSERHQETVVLPSVPANIPAPVSGTLESDPLVAPVSTNDDVPKQEMLLPEPAIKATLIESHVEPLAEAVTETTSIAVNDVPNTTTASLSMAQEVPDVAQIHTAAVSSPSELVDPANLGWEPAQMRGGVHSGGNKRRSAASKPAQRYSPYSRPSLPKSPQLDSATPPPVILPMSASAAPSEAPATASVLPSSPGSSTSFGPTPLTKSPVGYTQTPNQDDGLGYLFESDSEDPQEVKLGGTDDNDSSEPFTREQPNDDADMMNGVNQSPPTRPFSPSVLARPAGANAPIDFNLHNASSQSQQAPARPKGAIAPINSSLQNSPTQSHQAAAPSTTGEALYGNFSGLNLGLQPQPKEEDADTDVNMPDTGTSVTMAIVSEPNVFGFGTDSQPNVDTNMANNDMTSTSQPITETPAESANAPMTSFDLSSLGSTMPPMAPFDENQNAAMEVEPTSARQVPSNVHPLFGGSGFTGVSTPKPPRDPAPPTDAHDVDMSNPQPLGDGHLFGTVLPLQQAQPSRTPLLSAHAQPKNDARSPRIPVSVKRALPGPKLVTREQLKAKADANVVSVAKSKAEAEAERKLPKVAMDPSTVLTDASYGPPISDKSPEKKPESIAKPQSKPVPNSKPPAKSRKQLLAEVEQRRAQDDRLRAQENGTSTVTPSVFSSRAPLAATDGWEAFTKGSSSLSGLAYSATPSKNIVSAGAMAAKLANDPNSLFATKPSPSGLRGALANVHESDSSPRNTGAPRIPVKQQQSAAPLPRSLPPGFVYDQQGRRVPAKQQGEVYHAAYAAPQTSSIGPAYGPQGSAGQQKTGGAEINYTIFADMLRENADEEAKDAVPPSAPLDDVQQLSQEQIAEQQARQAKKRRASDEQEGGQIPQKDQKVSKSDVPQRVDRPSEKEEPKGEAFDVTDPRYLVFNLMYASCWAQTNQPQQEKPHATTSDEQPPPEPIAPKSPRKYRVPKLRKPRVKGDDNKEMSQFSDTASTPPNAEQLPTPPPTATFSLPQKRRSPSPPTDYANAPSAVKVVDTSTLDLTRSTVVEGNGTEVPQSEETTASGTNEQAVTEQTETAALEGKDTVTPVSSEATAADDTNGTNAPNSTIENGRK